MNGDKQVSKVDLTQEIDYTDNTEFLKLKENFEKIKEANHVKVQEE